ncbi:MAG: YceI family protein, partial [Cytophagales bacterium]|nr:YceI family protein [Cytophagales bacterium]
MKTNLILLVACLLLGATGTGGHAPPPVRRPASPPVASSIAFSIGNAGFPVRGTLDGIRADVSFHPDNLAGSRIAATADPATLRTGIGIRDKHLQRPDFFDVVNHPQIRLVSTAFCKKGKNAFVGQFELTIKGITKTVTLPFTRSRRGSVTTYRGQLELDRLDFKLGETSA